MADVPARATMAGKLGQNHAAHGVMSSTQANHTSVCRLGNSPRAATAGSSKLYLTHPSSLRSVLISSAAGEHSPLVLYLYRAVPVHWTAVDSRYGQFSSPIAPDLHRQALPWFPKTTRHGQHQCYSRWVTPGCGR